VLIGYTEEGNEARPSALVCFAGPPSTSARFSAGCCANSLVRLRGCLVPGGPGTVSYLEGFRLVTCIVAQEQRVHVFDTRLTRRTERADVASNFRLSIAAG